MNMLLSREILISPILRHGSGDLRDLTVNSEVKTQKRPDYIYIPRFHLCVEKKKHLYAGSHIT